MLFRNWLGAAINTCALLVTAVACSAEMPSHYSDVKASRDGTGKVYLGREISHVMGHLGAGWLERSSREREERTDLLIERLPLREDSVVADIGAGTGYFTFPVARRAIKGRVFAVDIQQEMLDLLAERSAREGVNNVVPVLGTVDDPGLESESIDLAFIVDAYHEFSHPKEMGQALARALRPGGYLVLVEYRQEDPTVPIKELHKMSEAQVKKEIVALDLLWLRTEDYLPQQHVVVFQKPLN